MPFCPKCRDEFQDWAKVCPDCGVELVEKLPSPPPKPKPKHRTFFRPLVTVATFSYPTEAHLNRAYLEFNGIESFVVDEHIITANWLYLTAVSGVKLQVRKSDAKAARALLKDIPKHIPEEVSGTAASSEERCPKCNSVDIRYEMFRLRAIFTFWFISFLIVGLLFGNSYGFTLPFLKRKWKCRSCGYEWRQEKQPDSE